MKDITQLPALYLGFGSLHMLLGHFGASLIYRLRFGASPLAYAQKKDSPHTRITRMIGVVSCLWGAGSVAYALWPASRSMFLLSPVISLSPLAGWILGVVGLLGMLASQYSMAEAFRIGQDQSKSSTQDLLKRDGMHAYSRNPIYVFSVMCLLGPTLWAPTTLGLALFVAMTYAIHRLVLEEEKYLASRFGAAYRQYQKQTPRYLGIPRRARRAAASSSAPSSRKVDASPVIAPFELTRAELRELQRKRPYYVLAKAALLLALWAGLSYLAWRATSNWARIPLWIAAGFVINGWIQLVHDSWHETLFEARWQNHAFGHLSSLLIPILYEPTRHAHINHHRYNRTSKDPDAYNAGRRSARLVALYYAVILFGIPMSPGHFNVLYPLQHFDAREKRRHFMLLALHTLVLGVLLVSLWRAGWLGDALMLWGVPLLFASPWNGLKSVADHYANDWNGSRFRTATTVRSNGLVNYLWNGLNYHLDHHLFPTVPGYNLARLHDRLAKALKLERSPVFGSYVRVWWGAVKQGPVFVDDDTAFTPKRESRSAGLRRSRAARAKRPARTAKPRRRSEGEVG